MDKSEYEEKRKKLHKKRKSILDKMRKLDEEFEKGKFKHQKKNIERYYINSIRQKYANTYYIVGDGFEEGYNGCAIVSARKIRIVKNKFDNGVFVGINTEDTWLGLDGLRNTNPSGKEEVEGKIQSIKGIASEELNKFNIEL